MMHQGSLIKILIGVLAASSAIVAGQDSAGSTISATPPVVRQAVVDYERRTITLSGIGFGTATPRVCLGGRVLQVVNHQSERIVARLPTRIRPSRYRLTVTSGSPLAEESRPFEMSIAKLEKPRTL